MPPKGLMYELDASRTNVSFNNQLTFTEDYNPYTFKNFLNGGGVAAGDINNDGLVDLFFTGNLVANKLYLNKGDFAFEDVTDKSNLTCKDVWCTGASMVDINHDGLLDVYICKSGKPDSPNRKNQFFINQGDLTFEDQAEAMGLAFQGLSIHSAFFDYDLDGDLDCYLLNNSIRSVGNYDIIEGARHRADESGNKLLKNLEQETGKLTFQDVSTEAGIYTSAIGFGLGVSISDLNADGWPDIYVSNDFFEKDYFYLNQKNGTFKEVSETALLELSKGSMGADIADLNNDAKPEIFVTEMLAEDLKRYKSKTVFESYDKSRLDYSKGYHKQYGRNTLQYNLGNVDEAPIFTELGRYHGVDATDWSWGALITDIDNNGLKDIFIANGIYKDLLDQDHVNFYNPQQIGSMVKSNRKDVILTMLDAMPSEPLSNYLYLQQKEGVFKKQDSLDKFKPNFSNGSIYVDLNNDGNLDLITNNINASASVIQNLGTANHYFQIQLSESSMNTHSIGSKVTVFANEDKYYQEVNPMRGYQSCVDSKLTFGLSSHSKIDSISIEWARGGMTILYDLPTDTLLLIKRETSNITQIPSLDQPVVKPLLTKVEGKLDFTHEENLYPDFDRNRLLTSKLTNQGPKAKLIDLTGDGVAELIVLGAKHQSSKIFHWKNNTWQEENYPILEEFQEEETLDVLFEDFNKDGIKDLVLINGGCEELRFRKSLRNVMIDDFSKLSKSSTYLDFISDNSSAISLDHNSDGKLDLVVSARIETGAYGRSPVSYVMTNIDGTLRFDSELTKPLEELGMVKKVVQKDIDGDGKAEIIFARDMLPLKVMELTENGWQSKYASNFENLSGFWNEVIVEDFDGDGDQDILALNLGQNNRLHNLTKGRLYTFVEDFDNNGRTEMILCRKEGEVYYPIHLKDEMMMQLPKFKKKSLKYGDYAEIDFKQLVGDEKFESSEKYSINEFRSGVFWQEKKGDYIFKPLPYPVQYTEQKSVVSVDLDSDGDLDLVIGGNQYEVKPEYGMYTGTYGQVILNNGGQDWEVLSHEDSGFFENGQIRDILTYNTDEKKYILVFKNDDDASVYEIN